MRVRKVEPETKVYIENRALFECAVAFPEGYEEGQSTALVIGLHGGGSGIGRFVGLWQDLKRNGFLYAVPRAPYPWTGEEEVLYDWALYPTGEVPIIKRASELTEGYVLRVVQYFIDRYRIEGVYLLGFSQGAIFAYSVGIKNHHLFRGLICFGGPGLLSPLNSPFTGSFNSEWLSRDEIEHANGLRVFISHGEKDHTVEYKLGVRSRDILKSYGYNVTFQSFEGEHNLPPKEILVQAIDWIEDKD